MPPDQAPELLCLREACGLDHERQIVTVARPAALASPGRTFRLRDQKTGRLFPAQVSRERPDQAFLELELRAGDDYRLAAEAGICDVQHPVALSEVDGRTIVSNGKWSAEIFLGEWQPNDAASPSWLAPTPIRRLRVKDGPWRGNFFFETREPIRQVISTLVETGPLRLVVQFDATIGTSHTYRARLTFDAGADFIMIDEQFDGESGDQIVWDFSGADLPSRIHLLDSTANFATLDLHYFFDRRLARLACWNQYSQLHDFSDGYALKFSQGEDVAGFVALRGGDWDGNAHNFLEAWTRRWLPGDRTSRRFVPPEAKADAAPSPERVTARPANECEAHFSVEGWLHRGRRTFALVLTSENALRSPEWNLAPALGHFEEKPDRLRYRQQQSLLRRIHTQRGMFSLEDQLATTWSWPREKVPQQISEDLPPWEHPEHFPFGPDDDVSIPKRIERILEFLEARVYGFWEGSGAAYTNAVVNRRVAEDLLAWEWLDDNGHVNREQSARARAWFVFLAHLLSSDHYYPGAALMNMDTPSKRMEPTIAGMANQNFFTDIFNFPGIAAQVFHGHPEASSWRERFTRMWRRQLEYHVYPQSGVWEESHTYFHHVLQTVLPTLLRRRDDGVEDGFADAAFQHLAASLLKTLTPQDACYGGKRHVVALGDHGVDPHDLYRPLYRILARHIAASNPKLASYLGWAYQEMGGTESLPAPPTAIEWRNEYVQGLGYFFRDRDARGESLMVLRCGNAWAHHHNDEGSLHYFYSGRAWIVDSAFSYPQETGVRKFRADGHSRWAPRDLYPLNYLWQFNRGWITRHRNAGPLAHAIAHTPIYMAETPFQQYVPLRRPIVHRRCVVELAPFAFLILDYTNIPLSQVTRFHVPQDAPLVLDDDAPPASFTGDYLRLCSLWGLRPAEICNADHPTQAGEKYATREIAFGWKEHQVTAALAIVDTPGSELTIRHEGSDIFIEHSKFAASLEIHEPSLVRIRDSGLGQQIEVDLNAAAS